MAAPQIGARARSPAGVPPVALPVDLDRRRRLPRLVRLPALDLSVPVIRVAVLAAEHQLLAVVLAPPPDADLVPCTGGVPVDPSLASHGAASFP